MNHNHQNQSNYSIQDFRPLILIGTVIVIFTFILRELRGWDLMSVMNDFMTGFFLVLGFFKIYNWHGFVEAYRSYDIIAKKSLTYAYAYPIIEIALGFAYLFGFAPQVTNGITLVVMLISSIGVTQALLKKETITCACLGNVFKIPMTYVTLGENLLMALMAFFMLFLK